MKIVVLGSTGMLGHAVGSYFVKQYGSKDVYLSYRNKHCSYGDQTFFFDAYTCTPDPFLDELYLKFNPIISKGDYIVNCIGVIKPHVESAGVERTILINSLFPWTLSHFCERTKTKLIHITTDCVFSGGKGKYTEQDLHDAPDLYGKSKSLGEPTNCMVLRTSIIGEELHGKQSLVEWAKSQKGQEVKGFTNHWWNGITTSAYAKVCEAIISENLYEEGVSHVFSPSPINKYELLKLLDKRFDLNLHIIPFQADQGIDRTLSTIKDLNSRLDIPSIQEQIENM